MYMTVLKMDFESLLKRKYFMDLENGDFVHKWLTSQFDKSRAEEKLLYRVDKADKAIFMYIQSSHPFPEKHIEDAGMKKMGSFEITEDMCKGTVRFKVLCFPNKTDIKTQKRTYIKEKSAREEWLEKRLKEFMDVESVAEIKSDYVTIKGGTRLPCSDFCGTGRIVDRDKFFSFVEHGLGKAKNYGAGLMLFKAA